MADAQQPGDFAQRQQDFVGFRLLVLRPVLQHVGGGFRVLQLRFHRNQVFVRFGQRALPIIGHGALDDRIPRSAQAPARIFSGVDRPRQAQAIEMLLGEQPIAGRAPLDRRQQAPIHVEPDGVGVDATFSFFTDYTVSPSRSLHLRRLYPAVRLMPGFAGYATARARSDVRTARRQNQMCEVFGHRDRL